MSPPDLDCHTLPDGQVLTLPKAAGRHLRVVSGRLWLTQSGDGTDHFLAPGQSHVLGLGRAVLEADRGPVRYTLTAQAQPRTTPARQGVRTGTVWGWGRRLTSP